MTCMRFHGLFGTRCQNPRIKTGLGTAHITGQPALISFTNWSTKYSLLQSRHNKSKLCYNPRDHRSQCLKHRWLSFDQIRPWRRLSTGILYKTTHHWSLKFLISPGLTDWVADPLRFGQSRPCWLSSLLGSPRKAFITDCGGYFIKPDLNH